MPTIGLAGAGIMGYASAEKIIEAGHAMIAFDPHEPSAARVKMLGASLASSPVDLAQQCEIILMFLPGPSVIEEVVAGPNGLLSGIEENSVIVDLSTTEPESTRKLAGLAAEQGVGYLDAPVLGRPASIGK